MAPKAKAACRSFLKEKGALLRVLRVFRVFRAFRVFGAFRGFRGFRALGFRVLGLG